MYVNDVCTMVPGIKTGRQKTTTSGNILSASEACPAVIGTSLTFSDETQPPDDTQTVVEETQPGGVAPSSADAFLRFLKWDVITLVTVAQGLKLSGLVGFEVKVGRLTAEEHEVAILEGDGKSGVGSGKNMEECDVDIHDEDFVSVAVDGDISYNDTVLFSRTIEHGSSSVDIQPLARHDRRNAKRQLLEVRSHICHATKKIMDLEMEINTKNDTISELHTEVDKLRRSCEVHTLHLVGGFGSLMQAKNDNLKKLVTENTELKKALNVLEDQFAKREVHNVTQTFVV
ncbi:hypothetical protein LOK49_Contig3G00010 [Camellia lanceoleosa]|nr:hypothetical protein LOK49_Contig3G00010 [Camellia lanceoleosa]